MFTQARFLRKPQTLHLLYIYCCTYKSQLGFFRSFCFRKKVKMSEMETSTLDESQVEEETRLSYDGEIVFFEILITLKNSEQVKLVNAISTPMASKKLTKRIFKCAKKASKEKTDGLRRGVKVILSVVRLCFTLNFRMCWNSSKRAKKAWPSLLVTPSRSMSIGRSSQVWLKNKVLF